MKIAVVKAPQNFDQMISAVLVQWTIHTPFSSNHWAQSFSQYRHTPWSLMKRYVSFEFQLFIASFGVPKQYFNMCSPFNETVRWACISALFIPAFPQCLFDYCVAWVPIQNQTQTWNAAQNMDPNRYLLSLFFLVLLDFLFI